jgi:hypothetical protein
MRLTEALLLRARARVPAFLFGKAERGFEPPRLIRPAGRVPDWRALRKLIAQGLLRVEAGNQQEFDCLLASGTGRLADARVRALSHQGRFALAYGAAHALSLAALRWHGFSAGRRYVVFRTLQYCMGLSLETRRLFDECNNKRNLSEYTGYFDVDEKLLAELLTVTEQLQTIVESLGPIASTSADDVDGVA